MRFRVLAVIMTTGLLWIAMPALAFAGDCPDDKGWYCVTTWATASPLLAAAAGGLLAGAALWNARRPPSPPKPPKIELTMGTPRINRRTWTMGTPRIIRRIWTIGSPRITKPPK